MNATAEMVDVEQEAEITKSDTRLRLFLADDHAVVRAGLRLFLNGQPDLCVIGEAESGRSAWEGIAEHQPDIVLMDISMPHGDGIETTARVLKTWPQVKVLALTMHADQSYLRRMFQVGASGYVLKRSPAEELLSAIRAIADGKMYVDPSLSATMIQDLMRRPGQPLPDEPDLPLSEREVQVLRGVAEGYTNKEIGVKLAVSEKTVETFKTRAMRKLDLGNRAEVVRYALRNGWFHKDRL